MRTATLFIVLLAICAPNRAAGCWLSPREGYDQFYLVNAEGKVAGSHLGRVGEADLRAMITAMLGAQ